MMNARSRYIEDVNMMYILQSDVLIIGRDGYFERSLRKLYLIRYSSGVVMEDLKIGSLSFH